MKNMLQKLFYNPLGKNQVRGKTLSAEEMKGLLATQDMDIGKAGFPFLEYNGHPSDSLRCDVLFYDVKKSVSDVITGKYFVQAVNGAFPSVSGRGEPVNYSFTIQNGKLNIKEIGN